MNLDISFWADIVFRWRAHLALSVPGSVEEATAAAEYARARQALFNAKRRRFSL